MVKDILKLAVEKNAADIFIVAGRPVSFYKNGVIIREGEKGLSPAEVEQNVKEIYELAGRDISILTSRGDDDFSLSVGGLSRFRVSGYKQRGSMSAVLRVISFALPDPETYNIPEKIVKLCEQPNGMVLVTGPAGSGKSSTLACMIDHINRTKESHVITLEDPIEYLHRHNKSIVSQREIRVDTDSYVTGLRAALRQCPQVILLGEMRDFETISVAMTAAETGHLLLSTLHTMGAANTINRIIDVYPANQQRQVAVQLSSVLNAVVSQQLLPSTDGGVIPAFEIMTMNPAIRNMIRDGKVHQLDGVIYSSPDENMVSMDESIVKLLEEGRITEETAQRFAVHPERLRLRR
ncbi:twitching motility protein PilT [Lachnospiraceae bacterium]|nr:twitching motility protein PilT [Lachnospiraceae bacterium]